ncbi:MAG: hypothetical protein IKM88_10310, partial [Lachnospiraceae bacterium]|nr:hypothetical protein [Lachnospiraceae bacterium]
PAIDVLASISRCMSAIADPEHKKAAGKLKNVLATYNDAEDLINIGAYLTLLYALYSLRFTAIARPIASSATASGEYPGTIFTMMPSSFAASVSTLL